MEKETLEKVLLGLRKINAEPKGNTGQTVMNIRQAVSLDFTQILENRNYRNMGQEQKQLEDELKKFFYNNRMELDAFIWQYDKFGRKIRQEREALLYECLEKVCEKTGKDWGIYQDWDLCISFNDEKRRSRIGIETRFRGETYKKPLGDLCIYVTVWEQENFEPYEKELKAVFPDGVKDDESWIPNRIVLRVAEIPANKKNIGQIVEELKKTYDKLEPIAAEHK